MENILGPVQAHGPASPATVGLLDVTQKVHVAKEDSWKGHWNIQDAKNRESVAARGEV